MTHQVSTDALGLPLPVLLPFLKDLRKWTGVCRENLMGSPLKNNFFISDISDITVHALYLSDIALCDVPDLAAVCVCV